MPIDCSSPGRSPDREQLPRQQTGLHGRIPERLEYGSNRTVELRGQIDLSDNSVRERQPEPVAAGVFGTQMSYGALMAVARW
jgi:hypothetical protein